jgi:phage minor structural protein
MCRVYAESSLCELLDDFVEDTVLGNATVTAALTATLAGSRWAIGQCDDLGRAGCWLYHMNALAALRKVCDVWKGEPESVITVANGRVATRTLSVVRQIGSWRGARFTYGKNLAGCTRTVLEDEVYTALYGYGAGLPNVDDQGAWTGGYRRKLTFGDVNGGVNWVGDEQARLAWGRWNSDRSAKVHSFGQITFSECDDPTTLLALTRAALPLFTQPRVSYELDVALIDGTMDARLGDTVAVVDKSRDPEWRLKARIVKRVRTFSDETQVRITLGTVQPASYSATSSLMERMAIVEDTAGAASDNVVAIGDAVTVDPQGTVEPIATQQYVDDAIANLDDLSGLDF